MVCVFFSKSACAALAVRLAGLRCLFFIFPNLSACAGLLVSGYWFSGHVSNCNDYRSGCNHYLHPRLSLVSPGASTLVLWEPFWQPGASIGTILAPWEHLGGVAYRILFDSGVNLGPYFQSLLGAETCNFNCYSGL